VKTLCLALAASITLAGCGDNQDDKPIDAATADARIADAGFDTGAVIDAQPPDSGPVGPPTCDPMSTARATKAIVLGADFGSPGTLASIDLTTRAVTLNRATVSSDPVVRVFGTCVFIINRFGADNIQVLRASDLMLIKQYSTGAGSNPHDLAVISAQKAYIARYGSRALQIVHPLTGAELGTIDLSGFDSGQPPEMESVVLVGSRALVTMERLDANFSPQGNGLVALIDTSTDTLIDRDPGTGGIQAVLLSRQNPFGVARSTTGLGWVSTVGDFFSTTGCVETIDPIGMTASGCIITQEQFGGSVNSLSLGGTAGYASVTTGFSPPRSHVVRFTLGGASPTPFGGTDSNKIEAQVAPDETVWVADTATSSRGIRVFAPSGIELTSAPLDIGKPPVTGGIGFSP